MLRFHITMRAVYAESYNTMVKEYDGERLTLIRLVWNAQEKFQSSKEIL